MTTRLEVYADKLFNNINSPYAGFLGAYNMGVWGLSVSGKPPLKQGLLATGVVFTTVPGHSIGGPDNPNAANFVNFYDTPRLWSYGDNGMDQPLYAAIMDTCSKLRISTVKDLSKRDTERVQSYLKAVRKPGTDNKPWRELATISKIQAEMDRVGAWSHLVSRWRAVIAQSCYLVDITSLSPPFSGHEAQIGICEGIKECLQNWIITARKNPPYAPFLMIRILFGMTIANAPGFIPLNTAWKAFYKEIESTLEPLSNEIAQLTARGVLRPPILLYGSDMGKPVSTFNHSKIVAGDGQYAIVGGHNMCEEVSSKRAPVIHDITCEVTGPGAKTANAFAGSLWLKAAESGRLDIYRFNWQKRKLENLSKESAKKWAPQNLVKYGIGNQKNTESVLTNQYWYYPMQELPAKAKVPPPDGSVPATAIMGIGRWGDANVFSIDGKSGLKIGEEIPTLRACHYASDTLKRMMIRDKENTVIGMAQQDLINAGFFGGLQKSEHTICHEIGKRLKKTPTGVAIQVVVSSRFTQNSEGLAYSYGDGPREAAERISDSVVGATWVRPTDFLPARLAALKLSAASTPVSVPTINSSTDPSFCTVAPLAFCQARGTTRKRGSYVWPDAKFKMEKVYTKGRFWSKDDAKELTFGPGNHSKVLYVSKGNDDSTGLVLIGSDNMYPSPLSEFSFVIEGKEAIEAFRKQYWDRLWGYSARLGFTVMSNGTVV